MKAQTIMVFTLQDHVNSNPPWPVESYRANRQFLTQNCLHPYMAEGP